MDFSLLAFLIFLLFLFLIFIFGRARPSGQRQGRKYWGRTLQDDNLSILLPPIVPIDDFSHTAADHHDTVPLIDPTPDNSTVDFGSSWDTSVDTSSTDFGGFDSGGGHLGSAFASEIGGGSDFSGSDFSGSDFGGGGDGDSF
jgi:hypothetical protein